MVVHLRKKILIDSLHPVRLFEVEENRRFWLFRTTVKNRLFHQRTGKEPAGSLASALIISMFFSASKHLKWGCSGNMKGSITDLKWGCSGNEGPQYRSQMGLFLELGAPVRTSNGAGSGNEGPQ
jgi:hypothetical protein